MQPNAAPFKPTGPATARAWLPLAHESCGSVGSRASGGSPVLRILSARPSRPLSAPSCQYEFYRKTRTGAEQSAGPAHSITSSARASSVGGTVPVTNTAAHRNFRAQAAAKRERLLAQLA